MTCYSGQGYLNLSAESYLQQTETPKILICCGHVKEQEHKYPPSDSSDDGKDLCGHFIHEHIGWYTIDKDATLHPDLVADIYDPKTLEYLMTVFHETVAVIYVEGWQMDGSDFLRMAYSVLKKHGKVVYTLGQQYTSIYREMLFDSLKETFFPLDQVTLIVDHFAYYYHRQLRQIISRMTSVKTIMDLDNEQLYSQLISDPEMRLYLFNYKVAKISGDFEATMRNLKLLGQVDPFLGLGISFEYDRQSYVIIEK